MNFSYATFRFRYFHSLVLILILIPIKTRSDLPGTQICLISPKNIWKSKDKIGINWVLVQAKIFQPIIKIDECLIMDEFEEQPYLNYHNISYF